MTWTSPSPKKEIHERSPGNIKSPRLLIVEAPTRIELVIEVLQTFALPLGYGAILYIKRFRANDSDGNRTRVTAVKGRCLNRLTTEPYLAYP